MKLTGFFQQQLYGKNYPSEKTSVTTVGIPQNTERSPKISRKSENSLELPIQENPETENLTWNSENPELRYAHWYPTFERTLTCLSKLYLTIDNDAFDGIAQEAMSVCTNTLVDAQNLIQNTQSTLDGQLFLIQHLLILQEEIAPFDINFTIQETVLDFSYIWSAIRALFSGQKPFFALSKDNAIWSVIAEAKPRVKNSEIDYKKDMENLLKQTKNAFITDVSNAVLKDIHSFLSFASAFLNTLNREVSEISPHQDKKLSETPFASPEKVKALIESSQKTMQQILPGIFAKLCIYLPEPKNQHELYKPIKVYSQFSISSLLLIL